MTSKDERSLRQGISTIKFQTSWGTWKEGTYTDLVVEKGRLYISIGNASGRRQYHIGSCVDFEIVSY